MKFYLIIKFPFTRNRLPGSTLKFAPRLMVWGTSIIHSPVPLIMMVFPAGNGLGGLNPSTQFEGFDQFPQPENDIVLTTRILMKRSTPNPHPFFAVTDKVPPVTPAVTVMLLVVLLPVHPPGSVHK
jgi:hypothetical protein